MRSLTYRKYLKVGMDLYNDFDKAKQYADLVTSIRANPNGLSKESFKEVRHLHNKQGVPADELALEYNVHLQEILDALNKTGRYKFW